MAQDIVYDRTMTVEEAIEILNSAALYGPVYEATQVIIKALSEQSLKHGHWVASKKHPGDFYCSVCGQNASYGYYGIQADDLTDFCPSCGAIMDEEKNNDI